MTVYTVASIDIVETTSKVNNLRDIKTKKGRVMKTGLYKNYTVFI